MGRVFGMYISLTWGLDCIIKKNMFDWRSAHPSFAIWIDIIWCLNLVWFFTLIGILIKRLNYCFIWSFMKIRIDGRLIFRMFWCSIICSMPPEEWMQFKCLTSYCFYVSLFYFISLNTGFCNSHQCPLSISKNYREKWWVYYIYLSKLHALFSLSGVDEGHYKKWWKPERHLQELMKS